jgi:WD40 repeat protein
MLCLDKQLDYHFAGLSHILILKDGRLSSSSADNSLIIYNQKTFEPDLIIREHTDYVNYHIQLKNENIVTCSWDETLKINKLLPDNKYQIIQKLEGHKHVIDKAIELEDGKLLTCSDDTTVFVWKKNKNNYFEVEKVIKTSIKEYPNTNIVLINENLLLCSSISDEELKFFDIKNDYKLMFSFSNVQCCFSRNSISYIEEKDLLLVGGTNNNGIYMFKLQKIPHLIEKFFPNIINCVYSIILMDNDNILVGLEENLDGEAVNSIFKFKIDKNNKLININKKSNAHKELINGLIDWKEKKLIVSCSKDTKVKLWTINKD